MSEMSKIKKLTKKLDDPSKRYSAIKELCVMQAPMAKEVLVQALNHKDSRIRILAAKHLGRVEVLLEYFFTCNSDKV